VADIANANGVPFQERSAERHCPAGYLKNTREEAIDRRVINIHAC
jgi:hypothetical protein